MISYISFYLLGGLIWSLIIEVLNNMKMEGHETEEMTNGQRFLLILTWPFYLLIFLVAFFKNLFKQ
jgi:hypothetical protein